MDPWWKPFELGVGETFSRVVGSSELTVQREVREWHLRARPETGHEPAALRVASSTETRTICLHPRLADRPVVARLEVPAHIAPDDQVTIYVGSPLSAELEIGPPDGKRVGEVRFFDPPDTWFGPNTRTGELCYASRTSGRLRRELVEHRLDRAVTAIIIENRTPEPLVFERVRIPVPELELYVADDGTLWTNRYRVVRQRDNEWSAEIESEPPTELGEHGELTHLAGSRVTVSTNLFTRAIGALL